MKTYEELNNLFGKSEQAYLVTEKPFSERAVILYMNEAASSLLKIQREETVNRTVAVLGLSERESISRFVSGFEEDMCLCLLAAAPLEQILAEYKKNQQRMEEALEAANVANRAKTKFLSEMSHDIRTPMNAILGMTDIALKHSDDSARVVDCLKKIQTASGHLMSLINEVLDMSSIESGKLTIMAEEFQLADMIHSIMVVIKAQAAKKNIKVHLNLDNVRHENLVGDSLRLRQIYINILSNAVKYTEDGGCVWIKVAQEQIDDESVRLEFQVRDNGIGMTPEFLKTIFDPFSREWNTTLSKIEGTGLGMSITKKLVEMMQGEITVKSKKGEGSNFDVRIPMKLSKKDDTFHKEAFEGKRVLILQGAQEKLDALPDMLKSLGIKADIAGSGMEAVEYLNDAGIAGIDYFAMLTADRLEDLEISLFLPEVCARMGREFPILLFSENDWTELEYLLKQAGVTSFVPLPLFESRLAEALFPYTQEGMDKQEQDRHRDEKSFEGCRILLVEDNELNREIALEILQGTGAETDTAVNGQDAVKRFAEKPVFYYDLILMDIQMPVMDGIEATKQIRAMKRADAAQVHIVAMTANAFAEDRKRSLEVGMDEHITKPLDVRQVLECLEKWSGR